MDKKIAIFAILVLMLAFLGVGILNVAMGKPSLLTARLNSGKIQQVSELEGKKADNSEKALKEEENRIKAVPVERILILGVSGDDVKRVQYILKSKGHYSGEINGVFDEAVEASVKQYQTANSLRASGKVGLSTIESLTGEKLQNDYRDIKLDRIINAGNKGKDVEKVQDLLKRAGYYSGQITGVFDEATRLAVKALQSDFKITTTGNVGNQTKSVLLDME